MSSTSAAASHGGRDRAERVRQIADDCLRRWGRGEAFSEAELIQANPDLLPELAAALQRIRRIAQAEQGSDMDDPPSSPDETADVDGVAPSSGCLHIRCPHCHNPVEMLFDSPFTDITCSTCGSAFSLVSSEAHTCHAPPLESIGHFELVSRLGIGAFGSVWKAHDIELDRTVAIKIPRRGQLDPIGEEQFLREARVAAQLRHPNIVSVHEVGREGDILYIVSDLVRGVSLSEWLTAKRPTARESAELGITIANALHYAHELTVVHRDLKPSNIMMDREDQPHLLDFGLAKRDAGELTMTADGQIIGTPTYMSPEQGEGEGHYVDRRSDIYSFGVILFELLTGELPFRGSAQMQIHQKVTENAPSPRKLNPLVPRDVATICTKCMERDPNRRYSTARALAHDLERFLRGEPIHARPISRTERTLRWAKRNPWMATAAALIVFLAIAGPIAAWSIETKRQLLDQRLVERNNLIKQIAAEKDRDASEISRLREALDAYEGRANPWELWPPRRAEGPRQVLFRSLLEGQSTALERRLEARNLNDEQALYLELTLAIISDESGRAEEAIRHYVNCVDRLQRLLRQQPGQKDYLLALADCSNQLARLHIPADREASQQFLEEARLAYQQLTTVPDIPQMQVERFVGAIYRAALMEDGSARGHLQQAEQIQRALEADLPEDPVQLYELTCLVTQRQPRLITGSQDKKDE